MTIIQAILAGIICLLTLTIGILLMKKEPYQASIKNGGFSKKKQYTKNIQINRVILPLSIIVTALIFILLLVF